MLTTGFFLFHFFLEKKVEQKFKARTMAPLSAPGQLTYSQYWLVA
jgi:hypothetical protein